ILCCLEGCTQEEAAARLGSSVGSVKGRLERARDRLQSRLARRGLSLGAALVVFEALRGTASATVPTTFLTVTLQAAHALAQAACVEPPLGQQALALAGKGLRSAGLLRTKIILSLLLVVGLVAAGLAAITSPGAAPQPEKPVTGK